MSHCSLSKAEQIFNYCEEIKAQNKKRHVNNIRVLNGGQGKLKELQDFPYTAYAMARKVLEATGEYPWSLKYGVSNG